MYQQQICTSNATYANYLSCTWDNYFGIHTSYEHIASNNEGNKLQHFLTLQLQNICQEQTCPLNAIYMSYAKITWCASIGKYAIIYAMYDFTDINHVTRSTVHRCQWWQCLQCRIMMIPQPNYIYWVSHWAKSVKKYICMYVCLFVRVNIDAKCKISVNVT